MRNEFSIGKEKWFFLLWNDCVFMLHSSFGISSEFYYLFYFFFLRSLQFNLFVYTFLIFFFVVGDIYMRISIAEHYKATIYVLYIFFLGGSNARSTHKKLEILPKKHCKFQEWKKKILKIDEECEYVMVRITIGQKERIVYTWQWQRLMMIHLFLYVIPHMTSKDAGVAQQRKKKNIKMTEHTFTKLWEKCKNYTNNFLFAV